MVRQVVTLVSWLVLLLAGSTNAAANSNKLYPHADVKVLTSQQIDDLTSKHSERLTLITLFNDKCSACRDAQQAVVNVSKATREFVTVAAVDCDSSHRLCDELSFSERPLFQLYIETAKPLLYTSNSPNSKFDAKAIVAWILKSLPSTHFINVPATAASLPPPASSYSSSSSSSSSSFASVAIVHTKTSTPSLLKALSIHLSSSSSSASSHLPLYFYDVAYDAASSASSSSSSSVLQSWFDSTPSRLTLAVTKAIQNGTVVFVSHLHNNGNNDHDVATLYTGKNNFTEMKAWILEQLAALPPPPPPSVPSSSSSLSDSTTDAITAPAASAGAASSPPAPSPVATSLPDPPLFPTIVDAPPLHVAGDGLPFLADQSCMEAICLARDTVTESTLCVILLTPSYTHTEAQPRVEAAKHLMRMVASHYYHPQKQQQQQLQQQQEESQSRGAFIFAYMDTTMQQSFLSRAFGLSPRPYPQLLLLSPKRRKYGLYERALDDHTSLNTVLQFLEEEVERGRFHLSAMGGLSGDGQLPSLTRDTYLCPPHPQELHVPQQPLPPLPPARQQQEAEQGHVVLLGEHGEDEETKYTASSSSQFVLAQRNSPNGALVLFYVPWCTPINAAALASSSDSSSSSSSHLSQLCTRARLAFNHAASRLRDMVRFVTVDCSRSPTVCEQAAISEYPTLKWKRPGGVPQWDYLDSLASSSSSVSLRSVDDASQLEALANSFLSDRCVERVTADTLAAFVSRTKPLCSEDTGPATTTNHDEASSSSLVVPRLLLIHFEKSIPSYLSALSREWLGRVVVGQADFADRDLVTQFDVRSVPSLFLLSKKMSPSSMEAGAQKENAKVTFSVSLYAGALTYHAVKTFLLEKGF